MQSPFPLLHQPLTSRERGFWARVRAMYTDKEAGDDPAAGKEAPRTFPLGCPSRSAFSPLSAAMVTSGQSPFVGSMSKGAVEAKLQGRTARDRGSCSRESLSAAPPNLTAEHCNSMDPSVGRSGVTAVGKKGTDVEQVEDMHKELSQEKSMLADHWFPHQRSHFHQATTSLVTIHRMNEHQEIEVAENNESHLLMFSEDQSHSDTSGTFFPTSKRKAIQHNCLSSSSLTIDQHHWKNQHFSAPSDAHVLDSTGVFRQLQNLFCSHSNVGRHHVGYPHPYVDAKELEDREWTRLLVKELTHSDVASLGRIVLPKREAEAKLPPLVKKDGLLLEMVDMAFDIVWGFKYRFWPNNRSRMYILENTGDFVKMHKLEVGDSFAIYGDKSSRYHLVGLIKKSGPGIMVSRNWTINQLLGSDNKVECLSSDQKERLMHPNTSEVHKPEGEYDGGSSDSMPTCDGDGPPADPF